MAPTTREVSLVLWAFVIVATIAAAIPLIFYVHVDSEAHIPLGNAIAAQQQILLNNASALLNQTVTINEDLIILRQIIVFEDAQVIYVSNLIDEINCRGVKRINGEIPTADPERNFWINGTGGVDVPNNGVDTVYVNATAIKTQYDSEQSQISTLFGMAMSTQMAINILDGEVLKSLNIVVLPDNATKNMNVYGECGTDVYPDPNNATGIVYVDMCVLQQNATNIFAGISFDFSEINNRLDQLLNESIALVNDTNTTYENALALENRSIFTINYVPSAANNIDLLEGPGISIVNGTDYWTLVLNNTGLVGVNGLNTSRNVDILPGLGIGIVNDAINGVITVDNLLFIPPCNVRSASLVVMSFLNFPSPTFGFVPFPQQWAVPVFDSPGCAPSNVFQTVNVAGITYGVFNMPAGTWTLSYTLHFFFTQPFAAPRQQMQFGLVGPFYTIPFNILTFNQQDITDEFETIYHMELTISDLEYPVDTQFSLQWWACCTPPAANSGFVFYTEVRLIKIR